MLSAFVSMSWRQAQMPATPLHAFEQARAAGSFMDSGTLALNATFLASVTAAIVAMGARRGRLRDNRYRRWGRAHQQVRIARVGTYAHVGVLETPSFETATPSSLQMPRVRFAPSPTGVLHVGGARTALFNFLFSKAQDGQLILRIEDTDVARSTAKSEAAIIDDLKWCGITWDEGPDIGGQYGPYRQSERIEAGIYSEQLDKLMSTGHVYRCFLTEEELDAMRREAERNDQTFVIDSPWAYASEAEVAAMLRQGKPHVYRFRVPRQRTIEIKDMVLGDVSWNTDDLGGDFVIVRNTGVPMYNFSVVVDDALMGITHVLRAQEHLYNTPKQVLLYEALGFDIPQFAHMPLILAPDRTKLSKRHGAVSVGAYKQKGYLPGSMVNYLSQLGWNDGTNKEIYDLSELVEAFKMERMSKVAAIFDKDKFRWVNSSHIKRMPDAEAVQMIGDILLREGVVKVASGEFVRKAGALLKNRISVLSEAGDALKAMLAFPVDNILASDEIRPWMEDGSLIETSKLLLTAMENGKLEDIGRDPRALKELVDAIGEARGVGKKKHIKPLRICLTGRLGGPDMHALFDLMNSIDSNVVCGVVPLETRLEQLFSALGLHTRHSRRSESVLRQVQSRTCDVQ